MFLFYPKHYWKNRSVLFIWSIESQFVSYYFGFGLSFYFCFKESFFHLYAEIGNRGTSYLSSALEVNSSITSLDLSIIRVFIHFNQTFTTTTKLVAMGCHHCQRHWRLIHPSLNCSWNSLKTKGKWSTKHFVFYNDIREHGASFLAEALKVNSTLLTLDLTLFNSMHIIS